MGFFSDCWGGLKSAGRSVVSAGRAAISKVKEKAGEAIGWMAEKGEQFVGSVKKVWGVVRRHVDKIQLALRAAAAATVGIPWLSAALLAVDKGITVLTAFENSPVAKKIDQAIQFAIKLAKKWQAAKEQNLEGEELAEARKHQETFRMAERESATQNERHQLELMAAINDFEIAKADLENALKGAPQNFEHYLRLRATQKLLGMSEKRFHAAKTVDDLSADDLFLVRVASDLVKENAELNQKAAERLDRILEEKYGKVLQSFIFEELISAWKVDSAVLENDLNKSQSELAKDIVLLRRLRADKQIQVELSEEDSKVLDALEIEVPKKEKQLDELATRQRDVERYANAAEGFLQLLEKTPEQLEMEDRDYVIEEGATVGEVIIKVANEKIPFSSLSRDEQALITDFANVFKKEAGERMKVLEVAA